MNVRSRYPYLAPIHLPIAASYYVSALAEYIIVTSEVEEGKTGPVEGRSWLPSLFLCPFAVIALCWSDWATISAVLWVTWWPWPPSRWQLPLTAGVCGERSFTGVWGIKKCIALTPEGGGDEEMFDSINSLSSCRVRVFYVKWSIFVVVTMGKRKGGGNSVYCFLYLNVVFISINCCLG